MNRNKTLFRRLLPWLIVLAALAALVIFVFIPIYTEKEPESGRTPVLHAYADEDTPVTISNGILTMEMDRSNTHFTIRKEGSDQVWYSNPADWDYDPEKNTLHDSENHYLVGSTLTLTYHKNGKAKDDTLPNFGYSIKNRNYLITVDEENCSIRVDYAIGEIDRDYIIPIAMTEARYNELVDKMTEAGFSKQDAKKVKDKYSKKDPAKLKEDEKASLIERGIIIGDEILYVYKADLDNALNKDKTEKYFKRLGYNMAERDIDDVNITERKINAKNFYNVSVIYTLKDGDLIVEVPYDDILYDANHPPTSLAVLPMFGSADTNTEGFILVPDGSGGIIPYTDGSIESYNNYYTNFYGQDYGEERTEAISEAKNAFCVFGMSQKNGSFICMIEGASAYGGIFADTAGNKKHNYNYAYCDYKLLHFGDFQLGGTSTERVLMFEKVLDDAKIVQRYRFLDGNSYSDMATAYGDYLRSLDEYQDAKASEDMPVNVELIGAINKVVPKLGVPVDSVVATTTFDQSREIIDDLSGIKNLNIRMTGWFNGGVRQKVITGVNVLNELGGQKGMDRLISEAEEKGVSLYFDGISCFAYDSDLSEGFMPYMHAARFATKEVVTLYSYNIVTFLQDKNADNYYLVKPKIASEYADRLIESLGKAKAGGVAFRDIGNLLSADYYYKEPVAREDVKAMNVDTLKKTQDQGLKISIKEGNDYALPYADLVTDMNLSGNGHTLIERSVPFYQIAVHGLKDYTGEAANLSGDYRKMILESAEYGAGLSYSFMKSDASVLQDTAYSCYTGSSYDRWKEEFLKTVQAYQEDMKGLNGQRIVRHEYLPKIKAEAVEDPAEGSDDEAEAAQDVAEEYNDKVRMTVYEDGTIVYVNYSNVQYITKDGVEIPGNSYLVKRGSAQ